MKGLEEVEVTQRRFYAFHFLGSCGEVWIIMS